MIAYRSMMYLLVAHPGHELLLHGWISRNKPVVHVLTDGTRLGRTAELLRDLGADAYRRETLWPVVDWTALDGDAAPPLYERYGEERVAAGRYTTVIRRREHMLPLRDALLAEVEKRSCAF